jgi:hypothetical protein
MNLTPKEYFAVMRRVQNFLKHADRDPEEILQCSLDDLEGSIMAAAMNAGEVGEVSPSVAIFQLWYLAKWRSIFTSEFKPGSRAEELFPGLASMSHDDQRAFGAQRLREDLPIEAVLRGR